MNVFWFIERSFFSQQLFFFSSFFKTSRAQKQESRHSKRQLGVAVQQRRARLLSQRWVSRAHSRLRHAAAWQFLLGTFSSWITTDTWGFCQNMTLGVKSSNSSARSLANKSKAIKSLYSFPSKHPAPPPPHTAQETLRVAILATFHCLLYLVIFFHRR